MDELIPLSDATLRKMPGSVRRPHYQRSKLRPGIVHIGLGNFHRAHLAWYLHRLFDTGRDHDWAIIGAGVRAADAIQREKLLAQDCLTTLIELNSGTTSAEISGAMIDFLPIEPHNGALITQISDPAVRIVSLTVTEGGYYVDPATGCFDALDPDMVHDVKHPDAPRSAFGAIVAALRLRRDAGVGPLTCLSCDNLQSNGAVLRQTVLSLARLSDPGLAEWIDGTCSFPNSMVDCIVPATGAAEVEMVRTLGIADAAPVTHENFRQWVVEDDFCAGRPAWEHVGVTFSERVHDFEQMKIRILNGGHQIIASAGALLGLETIAETMANRGVRALLHKVVRDEIAPHVTPVPDCTPDAYLELIDRRFTNPKIADTTRRVAFDGSSRQPGFILPSVRDGLDAGTPVDGLALVSALWARYCAGTSQDGSPIAPNDPHWDILTTAAKRAETQPDAWLDMKQFYGDLGGNKRFFDAFAGHLGKIYDLGVEAAIASYLGEP